MASTWAVVDVAIVDGETVDDIVVAVVVVVVVDSAATVTVAGKGAVVVVANIAAGTLTTLSLLVASSIEGKMPLLLLSRVNDSDDNDASTTCSALTSLGIVSDPTNSFIVPL